MSRVSNSFNCWMVALVAVFAIASAYAGNEDNKSNKYYVDASTLPTTQRLATSWDFSLGNVLLFLSLFLFALLYPLLGMEDVESKFTGPAPAVEEIPSHSTEDDSSASTIHISGGGSFSSTDSVPARTSKAASRSVGEAVFKLFMHELENKDSYSWRSLVDSPELTVMRREDVEHGYFFRAVLENTAEVCYQATTDERNWGLEDIIPKGSPIPNLVEVAETVERLDAFTTLMYGRVRRLLLIPGRDGLCHVFKAKLPDESFVMTGSSIDLPVRPKLDGYNRVTLDVGGVIFKNEGPGRCIVVGMGRGNPNGWVPETLVNIGITQVAPQSLKLVNKILKKIPAHWTNVNNPVPPEYVETAPIPESLPPVVHTGPAVDISAFISASGATLAGAAATPSAGASTAVAKSNLFISLLVVFRRAFGKISPIIVWIVYFLAWFQFFKTVISMRNANKAIAPAK